MSVSPCLDIFNVSTAKIKSNSLSIPIQISGKTEKETLKLLRSSIAEQEENSLTRTMQKILDLISNSLKNRSKSLTLTEPLTNEELSNTSYYWTSR